MAATIEGPRFRGQQPFAMPSTVTLTTFFRPDGATDRSIGPERYIAGFEDQVGESWGVAVPLEPDDVESIVLGTVSFSVSMDLDGTLTIDVEGRGDAANAAIQTSGSTIRTPLDDIVRSTLGSDMAPLDDDIRQELSTLRGRLATALRAVDDALDDDGR